MLNFNIDHIPQSAIITGASGEDLYFSVLDKIKKFYQDENICRRIDNGNFTDIKTIGRNDDNIKVAEIREISGFLHMSAGEGMYKFVIICNAENMNETAANGLLKALEEPPKNSYIFLLSFFPQQLLETIRSRCQILYLSERKEIEYDAIFDRNLLAEKEFHKIDKEQFKDYYFNFIDALKGDAKLLLGIIENAGKKDDSGWQCLKLALHNLYMRALKNANYPHAEEEIIKIIRQKFSTNLPDTASKTFMFLADAEQFHLDKRAAAVIVLSQLQDLKL